MKCPSCQAENRSGAQFCGSCGTRLSKGCPRCGIENPPDNVFCDRCGSDVREVREVSAIDLNRPRSYTPASLAEKILTTRSSIEGERKLVTVLFADVADYTSISERLDPEQVHRIMGGCFRILLDEVHRYEGIINQFTGDGAMALFGVPLAHENHAQRACHAALSIQKALAAYGQMLRDSLGLKFQMRMGLNSGTVIVASVGDDLKMDYMAVGDTTNLAARMQALAQPGTILVAEHTQKLARDFFEFRSLGKLPIKGKAAPQEAYELVRARAVETRIQAEAARGLTPFVGRTKEMEALKEAFDRARSGLGQVIGITGDAGVGKSRLLLEFRSTLPNGACTCLEGRCLHYGESMPYLPVLDMLKLYFEIGDADQEGEIKKKVRERLGRVDGGLSGSLAPLEDVLSLKVEDPIYLEIEPQQRKERIFETIRDLLHRVSKENPLVLALEDLHWIDKTSQEFVDFLAGSLSQTSILLMLLYRPEYRRTPASRAYCRELPLDQLSETRSADLVKGILEGAEVASEISELVLTRAGGNPLFVEEFIRSLIENGAIRRTDHRYELTREVSALEVPDTIQGIIAARMDRLGENLKQILQAASVIGTEFGYSILQSVLEDKEELRPSLLFLQGLEFIYEKQGSTELEYAFKHALTQEVAYSELLTHIRREMHERTGRAIEEHYPERLGGYYELLAYHYVRSDNKEKAAEYLDLASQKAFGAGSMEDALGYAEQAMELLDTLPDTEATRERRMSVMVNQARTLWLLLRLREAYDLFSRYAPRTTKEDRPGKGGTLYYGIMGAVEFWLGFIDKAIQSLTKAAEYCEVAGKAREALHAYGPLLIAYCAKGDFERGLAFKDALIRKSEETSDILWYVRGLSQAAMYYAFTGRFEEGLEAGQMALRRAQEYSSKSQISIAAFCISAVYTVKRDLGRAIEYGEMAVALAPTPADRATAQVALAWAWCHAGEAEKGTEILAGLVSVFRAVGYVILELWAGALLADGYRAAGRYEEAEQTARELLEVAGRCGARFYATVAHFVLAESLSEADPKQAAVHFEKSIATFSEIKAEAWLPLAYAGYGRLHRQQGNLEQARDYLTKALEIFDRLGILIEPDKARKELAELPG